MDIVLLKMYSFIEIRAELKDISIIDLRMGRDVFFIERHSYKCENIFFKVMYHGSLHWSLSEKEKQLLMIFI